MPKPLAARPVVFPPYEVRTLPNGLRVVVVEHHEQPLVSLRMLIGAGSAGRRAKARRRQTWRHRCSTRARHTDGAADRGSGRLHRGNIAIGAGTDVTFAHLTVLKDSAALGLELISDIVRSPAFSPDELERQRGSGGLR